MNLKIAAPTQELEDSSTNPRTGKYFLLYIMGQDFLNIQEVPYNHQNKFFLTILGDHVMSFDIKDTIVPLFIQEKRGPIALHSCCCSLGLGTPGLQVLIEIFYSSTPVLFSHPVVTNQNICPY